MTTSNQDETQTNKRVNKVGNWTNKEIEFIHQNANKMSIEDIAAQLNRNEVTVRNYIRDKMDRNSLNVEFGKEETEFNIKKSPIWKEIKNQITDDEIEIFLYHWTSICAQFRGDILPTERMQIVDICRNEVLLDRILKKIKDITVYVESLKDQVRIEKAKPTKDMVRIADLERLIGDSIIASQSFSKEHKDLSDQKQRALKEVKGTREQRIKRIEDSKASLTTWMSNIVGNPELRRKFALEAERMRLALNVELGRLSEYYKYADGVLEQPILSADTLKDDNS